MGVPRASTSVISTKIYALSMPLTDPLLVLTEYVPFGDLLGYLRKSRGMDDTYYRNPNLIMPQTGLTSNKLMNFAWQIADGMSYLSSKSVRPSSACQSFIRFKNDTQHISMIGC